MDHQDGFLKELERAENVHADESKRCKNIFY